MEIVIFQIDFHSFQGCFWAGIWLTSSSQRLLWQVTPHFGGLVAGGVQFEQHKRRIVGGAGIPVAGFQSDKVFPAEKSVSFQS